jgi:hypothetical protein
MTNHQDSGFTPRELRKLRSLKDPHGIQKHIEAMPYHLADTAWSPRRVLAENTSHCLEGAIFAAAALRANGYPPLIVDLEAEHDTDHVIAVYRIGGYWGSLAKSNYTNCRYREPVYRTIRELALSYFNGYINLLGERTLRRYSRPVNLARFDADHWMTTPSQFGSWCITCSRFRTSSCSTIGLPGACTASIEEHSPPKLSAALKNPRASRWSFAQAVEP